MSDGQLFELPPVSVVEETLDAARTKQATGGAVEALVTAELLLRGHKVAVPVVDDDGVDLVVNYRTKVQVKATSYARGRDLICASTCGSRKAGEPFTVDVFVVYDLRESRSAHSRFFVVPTSLMTLGGLLSLNRRFRETRGAWHVFDEMRDRRAA